MMSILFWSGGNECRPTFTLDFLDPSEWSCLHSPFLDCDDCDGAAFWSDCIPRLYEARDPLMVLRSLRDTIHGDRNIICEECRESEHKILGKEYNRFFKNLLSFFGLD